MTPGRYVVLGVLGVCALTACSGGGSDPTSAPPRSSSPSRTASPSPLPTLPALPTDLAGADPCATASTALTAASVYVGLAQLGRTAEAQRCVGGGVAESTTRALTATAVTAYYVPVGTTTGTTVRFRQAEGTATVTVTVARAARGYDVTAVTRG